MDSNLPNKGEGTGFEVNMAGMDEAHQTLIEVRDYFQDKVDTLTRLENDLEAPFFRGHKGETGAFQKNYQAFGIEWIEQLKRVLVLDQRFVALIAENGQAIKNSATMYAKVDDDIRSKFHSILTDTAHSYPMGES